MRTRLTVAALAAMLAACAAAPRTSTEEERAAAQRMLTTVEAALIIMHANGAIEPDDYARAIETIADLRRAVEESATKPFDWGQLMVQVAQVAARWLSPVPGETP